MTDLVRVAILTNPYLVRSLLPTKKECEVLMMVKMCRETTSEDVAAKFEISIQQASNYLLNLFHLEFLDRRQEVHTTGGIYYVYAVKPHLSLFVTKKVGGV
jgi:predicted transcriptional regulator